MSTRIFATQGEVLEFLRGLGLKISRTKISSDYRSGRLKCTSDKQFREEDVLAYAESLKAPAVQEKADKAQKLKAELARQKALLSSLLEAVPDDHAVKLALEKWLAKNGDEADDLAWEIWSLPAMHPGQSPCPPTCRLKPPPALPKRCPNWSISSRGALPRPTKSGSGEKGRAWWLSALARPAR